MALGNGNEWDTLEETPWCRTQSVIQASLAAEIVNFNILANGFARIVAIHVSLR